MKCYTCKLLNITTLNEKFVIWTDTVNFKDFSGVVVVVMSGYLQCNKMISFGALYMVMKVITAWQNLTIVVYLGIIMTQNSLHTQLIMMYI